jgi:hypothetical protein
MSSATRVRDEASVGQIEHIRIHSTRCIDQGDARASTALCPRYGTMLDSEDEIEAPQRPSGPSPAMRQGVAGEPAARTTSARDRPLRGYVGATASAAGAADPGLSSANVRDKLKIGAVELVAASKRVRPIHIRYRAQVPIYWPSKRRLRWLAARLADDHDRLH